jgi:probable rRNA maturation factor
MSTTAQAAVDPNTSIDCIVESDLWTTEPGQEAIIAKAIAAAAQAVSSGGGEVAILLTDDSSIRALNRAWRNQDKPTNVLSFPAKSVSPPGQPRHLGDIVIAFETAHREAEEAGMPLAHHLAHLAVHGYLHLLGYDHDNEDAAREMEGLETAILARLEIPDPYLSEKAAGRSHA